MAIGSETVIAANRFGMGAKPGELKLIGGHPREWLMGQLKQDHTEKNDLKLPSSSQAFQVADQQRAAAQQISRAKTTTDSEQQRLNQAADSRRKTIDIYQQYVQARSEIIIASDQSFRERLIQFWSNHFAVSADQARTLGLMPTLEFEAIRPNISGNFSTLLIAVTQHPAMISYLDNQQSIGSDSILAQQAARRNVERKLDINENLAREILELHTLGVNGGYTQIDVENLANVISGWSIGGLLRRANRANIDTGTPGEFHFNQLAHQPGTQIVLDKQYTQSGIEQGEHVLRDLAMHPSTARFLATKLARHFIADNPPESAISQLEKTYLAHDGELTPVYKTLVSMDEAWQIDQQKYKTPKEYIYSIYRSLDNDIFDTQRLLAILISLGQQPFKPGSPAGWPDTVAQWSGGDALIKRIEIATRIGTQAGNRLDPEFLAEEILGPILNDHTKTEINRAESGSQGLALLFASPEFMRR